MVPAPRTSGTSRPGSPHTGEATAGGIRPIPGSPDPSVVLPTSTRTGAGHPRTVPRHPPGTTGKTTKDLRTILERAGTRLVPGTPETPLALLTSLGRRRTGDGHPTTVPHGLTQNTMEDQRAALQRTATWIRHRLALAPSPGPNSPQRSSGHPGPPAASTGKQPPFKSNAPRPLPSSKDAAQHKEQTPPVGPPGVSEKVPEPPKAADTPQDSLAAGPQAAAAGAEPEQAGVTPVEPGAGQDPEGSQDPSALQTEEESSARTGQHPEVEPSSPSVPEAGAGGGSRPQTPTAPTEPAQRVCAATGEGDAELCPQPPGRQRLPGAAGAAEAGSAHHGLLSDLQTPENSPVPAGAAAEPGAQPGQAGSDSCTAPVTSPGTWHPPGSAETEPVRGSGASAPPEAADGQHQLCSVPPASSPAGTDLRSATVLARKEEIELSYQQFSLTVAMVATMLLQKEPSMEAALGLALRANLRQRRLHHLTSTSIWTSPT
ncbi:basic proline-rich protein-like [Columba livia]|uniref:Basic proline-rich protein-like n=1 Tax=Columba livia TaxID=8932 RepID=A0A2I0LML6_COLLI|nr:basic proline-rich protein-like [Columba livia]